MDSRTYLPRTVNRSTIQVKCHRKLNLSKLKVESFTTKLDNRKEETVKGGGFLSIGRECTQLNNCPWADSHTCGPFCKDAY